MKGFKRYREALDEIIEEELPLFNKRHGLSYDNPTMYRLFIDAYGSIPTLIQSMNFEEFSIKAKTFYRSYNPPRNIPAEMLSNVIPKWGANAKPQGKIETIIKVLFGSLLGYLANIYGF